jgi:inositol-phosphate phosphatase/L-galactose 1-phosphate phosphatase/histidinol-phosphatase
MDSVLIRKANEMADLAREISVKNFRRELSLSNKLDESPVSNIDIEIERTLYQFIAREFPDYGYLGEELGEIDKESPYKWVIDPIDGTSSFVSGKPTFCTLISLLFEGSPILGIIDQPISGERWLGQNGQPSEFNSKTLKFSAPNTNYHRLACTTPFMFSVDEYKVFESLSKVCDVTSFGGDAYNYGLLSLGHIDTILESDLKFYDVAALVPIVEGSGGCITTWKGESINIETFDGRVVATAPGRDHKQILYQIQL